MKTINYRFDKNALAFFNTKNGAKIRLSLGKYSKASRPELADLKITDWCDVGCLFCYQNSDLLGKHASLENIEKVITALSKAKVFECAIGGGEPTGHPDFIKILEMFNNAGVIPNFTTKKPAYIRKNWENIENLIGGFAYSAETSGQIHSAAKMFKNVPNNKISLHYVMGLGNKDHFKEYLKAAAEHNYRVTLLGYKTSGRGKDVIPFPYNWWIEAVNELIKDDSCPSLSIDTPLAEQFDGLMPVEKHTYFTREGAYSMYINTVNLTFGASSFEDVENLIKFDKNWKKSYKNM